MANWKTTHMTTKKGSRSRQQWVNQVETLAMKETTLYLQKLMIHFTFSIQPEDCSRKDLDKEIPVLGVQEQAHESISTCILYFWQISIYSSLFFGKAMNENEFETKKRNLSKL